MAIKDFLIDFFICSPFFWRRHWFYRELIFFVKMSLCNENNRLINGF
jgi:hypothetical protein